MQKQVTERPKSAKRRVNPDEEHRLNWKKELRIAKLGSMPSVLKSTRVDLNISQEEMFNFLNEGLKFRGLKPLSSQNSYARFERKESVFSRVRAEIIYNALKQKGLKGTTFEELFHLTSATKDLAKKDKSKGKYEAR